MLCQSCLGIHFHRPHQVFEPHSYFHVLHRTRSSFLSSIDGGCNFCILVRSQLGLTEVEDNLVNVLQAYVALRLRILDEADEGTDCEQPWSINIISRLGNVVLDVIGDIPGTVAIANIICSFAEPRGYSRLL